MQSNIAVVAALAGVSTLSFTFGETARAQDRESYLSSHELAPSNALELKAASGYTQGFGNIAPGRTLKQVGGAGIGVSAELDYRLSQRWSVGLEGQYQALSAADNSSARGITGNLGATYHLNPVLRGDPWARLGTGYRWVSEDNVGGIAGMNSQRHGFELATAKVGYDVRVSKDVAFAPVVGADLNLFVWENNSGSATQRMSTAQVATFVYAGLQALGARRARNVSGFLKEVGVDETKIDQQSRGERDARGVDEASWQIDRRVDVLKGQ